MVEWIERVPVQVPMLRVAISIVDGATRRIEVSGAGARAAELIAAWR